jgi:hypothetical protein
MDDLGMSSASGEHQSRLMVFIECGTGVFVAGLEEYGANIVVA